MGEWARGGHGAAGLSAGIDPHAGTGDLQETCSTRCDAVEFHKRVQCGGRSPASSSSGDCGLMFLLLCLLR